MATSPAVSLSALTPARAIHPGEILVDELEFAGITQRELARMLDRQVSVINEIIRGKRRLSADLAVQLESVLDLTAEHWNNLQAAYDLDQARIQQQKNARLPALATLRDLKPYVPMTELRKRGLLVDDAVADMEFLFKLYRVSSKEELIGRVKEREQVVEHFRRSDKLQTSSVNLTAWVMLAQEAARRQRVASFKPDVDQRALIADLHQLLVRNENVVAGLQAGLAEAGIKLVIVDHLPQTPIDGMAWWCEAGECPAIALTLRHKRLDNLIFTLFHELGHVFLHLTKAGGPCEFLDLEEQEESNSEREADAWATRNLVPADVLERFLSARERMQDDYLQETARQAHIHPAVLLGQRCHVLRDFGPLKKAKYNQIG